VGDGSSIAESIRAIGLKTPIAAMAGIGPKRAEALNNKGIRTVEDLLFHLPARWQDWRERRTIAQLEPGTIAVVEGTLSGVRERPMPGARWRRLVIASLTDAAGGQLRLVWFNLPSYMRGRMPDGLLVAAYGRVTKADDGHVEMMQPELRSESSSDGTYNDKGGPVRPVYRIPEGIPQRLYASLVATALDQAAPKLSGAIPEPQRIASELATIGAALEYLHRPPVDADLKELKAGRSIGHRTLAFDELFGFELAMCVERERSRKRAGIELRGGEEHRLEPVPLTEKFLATIPFEMTGAQRRTLEEIGADLAAPRQMNRILIGDVGSGKTAVAFWAMLRAVESGAQALMMAPTELLAEQHHRSFQQLCGELGIRSELLTARIVGAARAATMRDLARGDLPIAFGTQALIQQNVRVARLGLGIVDEQHRFGVFDRAKLKALGPKANVLMMTATPIPRSLAMSLFANLDVSVLDELPPGRTPIATEIYPEDRLDEVDGMVQDEIARGHRAYYVLPLIYDDNDDVDSDAEVKTVNAMAARMRKGRLRDAGVGILHGRMKGIEKDRVMRDFRDGIIKVLIATTVVEVGIDVPEATVIAIIAAERYGLAQLHQLRGRVGRGAAASRCCLVTSREADEAARARLQVLVECTTGNAVAQADLDLRGPGDLLGARQTGALPLRFLRFVNDPMMIGRAREMAEAWLKEDAALKTAASRGAKAALRKMLAMGFSLADVG
jgi:ATP-dependent DNA helicase RecG